LAVFLLPAGLLAASPAGASHPEACVAEATVRPSPPEYRPTSGFTHVTVADARGVEFTTTQVEGWYPVILKDGSYPAGGTFCFLGGSIVGNDTTTSWDTTWHKSVSAYSDHPYTTWRGTRISQGGDCIGIKDPGDASLTRIQGVSAVDCGDDAVENDLMKNVEVTDSLLEGYVLFAGRGGSAGAEDGRNNTYKINHVVGWLKPQRDVYKGSTPGNGPLFKRPCNCSTNGWEPNYTITNSIFRIDKVPNHGDLSIPPGPHSGNTIVWTGAGPYPGQVPAGFTVTADVGAWERSRAAWMAVPQSERSAPGVYTIKSAGTPAPPPPPPPPPAEPSTVTLVEPANGSTVLDTIELDATAPGASKVTYLVDGVEVAEDASPSDFSEEWDTTTVPDGTHEVVARAGGVDSAPHTITVDNVC
jgi:Bacterial Ig domain